jgi:hypothetical protein
MWEVCGARALAFAPSFSGGVFVAAGDVNGDGRAEIIVGVGRGSTSGPQVEVIDVTGVGQVQTNGQIPAGAVRISFSPFSTTFTGGVRVGSVTFGNAGRPALLTGAGPGGGPQVSLFDGLSAASLDSFFAFAASFSGGVFVAGA